MDVVEPYNSFRPYLIAIAYNMLGQVQEAEDVVQDAFEDILQRTTDISDVRNPRSYLTRIVLNKSIDRLEALKRERSQYPALWLPEPYITDEHHDNKDILDYAFVALMENLNPVERAVVLLREAFDYDYEEIAALIDSSEANSRQILHRAKKKLEQSAQNRKVANRPEDKRLLDAFLHACLNKDSHQLSRLLKEDVEIYSDGGGKVVAARKIISGLASVGKFILGIIEKTFNKWSEAKPVLVNGRPALLMPDDSGVYMILIPQIADGKIRRIFLMRNPDKIFPKTVVTKPE